MTARLLRLWPFGGLDVMPHHFMYQFQLSVLELRMGQMRYDIAMAYMIPMALLEHDLARGA